MFACRVWFVWLLMLALPLQGLAAASMQYCAGKSGAASAESVNHAQVSADPSGHDGHQGHQAHDGHGVQAASAHHGDSILQAHDADAAAGDGSGAGHKCTLCALCGHGVALNEFPASLEFGDQAHASPREPTVLIPAVAVLVPDKPPRA